MSDQVLLLLIVPLWLLFGWAFLKVICHVWRAKRSLLAVMFLNPVAMLENENRRYFWIMLGCMAMMVVATVTYNVNR